MRFPFRLNLVALVLILVCHHETGAQDLASATLSGMVTDTEGRPLPGVNVYLAGSQRGTVTDGSGRYRLARVPLGVHRLVTSIIGFETQTEDLHLRRPGAEERVDFRMAEAVLELGAITVEATEDVEWQRRFERFKRRFIGESPNASETEILNPHVLNFSERLGELKAEAAEPLVIENRALGYRIRYDLTDFEARSNYNFFHGEPLYEEMEPEGPEEAHRWAANRAAAYAGSFRHAVRSIIADRADEEGFRLYLLSGGGSGLPGIPGRSGGGLGRSHRFETTPEDILRSRNDGQEYDLRFPGILQVVYTGEPEHPSYLESEWAGDRHRLQNVQTSEWRFKIGEDSARLDRFGEEVDPRSITVSGYMTFDRLADELPVEYGLAESGIPGAAEAVRAWMDGASNQP